MQIWSDSVPFYCPPASLWPLWAGPDWVYRCTCPGCAGTETDASPEPERSHSCHRLHGRTTYETEKKPLRDFHTTKMSMCSCEMIHTFFLIRWICRIQPPSCRTGPAGCELRSSWCWLHDPLKQQIKGKKCSCLINGASTRGFSMTNPLWTNTSLFPVVVKLTNFLLQLLILSIGENVRLRKKRRGNQK